MSQSLIKTPVSPVRVMIVEDSLVIRALLTHIVGRDPRLTVAAAVGSAEEAIAQIARVRPDVISMDIRLPGMNGLEATRVIMSRFPTPIVVIAGGIDDPSLDISMNALRAGALAVLEKPVGLEHSAYEDMAANICTQLYIMSQVAVVRQRLPPRPTGAETPEPLLAARPRIIGVAASTGGPPALAKFLGALPPSFPLPVLVVQHMGAAFMEGFAAWLNTVTQMETTLARDGEAPQSGRIYVAPGNRHLGLSNDGNLSVSEGAMVGGQRPAATILFRSMAAACGAEGCGIVLTGMGEDGADGLAELRRAGGYTIAEHESTAVVYGMPGAAVRAGAVSVTLPLDVISDHVLNLINASRR
jgi:two-component system chemotaxis response regulator CheB